MISVRQAAAEEHVSGERVSRLATKACSLFEATLESLTRRGRPNTKATSEADSDLRLTRALLDAATSVLLQLKGSRRKLVRELLVGAWTRLSNDFASLTQQRFCAALALPTRTLHAWLNEPRSTTTATAMSSATSSASSPEVSPKPLEPKKRRTRRGRFRFDVLLPGTQMAGDTTDASAFGVPLKIIGVQDVGGRDQNLLESVIVDETENSDLVNELFAAVLKPGMQAITDQGTPFMAEATKAAFESKQVEHAPQREGDPLGKSTLERAWRTLKGIGAPLLGLSDRLADQAPGLRTPELAVPFVRVVISALLKAYQAGARAASTAVDQRGAIDLAVLARLAEESRNKAVAAEKSVRLFLEHIHTVYLLEGSMTKFIRSFKGYPLEALKDAELALRASFTNIKRTPLHSPARFFAARVRAATASYRSRQADAERSRRQRAALNEAIAVREARSAAVNADPIKGLRVALATVASCWNQTLGALLCDGLFLRASLSRLRELHTDVATVDIARAVLHEFHLARFDDLGPNAIAQIEAKFERVLSTIVSTGNNPRTSPIQLHTGPQQRPPPAPSLRI